MDFAQAKIHSLVTVADEDGEGGGAESPDNTERLRFKEVEARFLSQFSMPEQEKLVNCELITTYIGVSKFTQNSTLISLHGTI